MLLGSHETSVVLVERQCHVNLAHRVVHRIEWQPEEDRVLCCKNENHALAEEATLNASNRPWHPKFEATELRMSARRV